MGEGQILILIRHFTIKTFLIGVKLGIGIVVYLLWPI